MIDDLRAAMEHEAQERCRRDWPEASGRTGFLEGAKWMASKLLTEGYVTDPALDYDNHGYQAGIEEAIKLAREQAEWTRANSSDWEERETVKVCPASDTLDKFADKLEALG